MRTRVLAIDVTVVLAFVAIGRRSHAESGAVAAVLGTAVPFLMGLVAGWAATRAWRRPQAITTGVGVWVATVVVGMAARRWIFDDGTATSFVLVAAGFLGAGLLGWRLMAAPLLRRQRAMAR